MKVLKWVVIVVVAAVLVSVVLTYALTYEANVQANAGWEQAYEQERRCVEEGRVDPEVYEQQLRERGVR